MKNNEVKELHSELLMIYLGYWVLIPKELIVTVTEGMMDALNIKIRVEGARITFIIKLC